MAAVPVQAALASSSTAVSTLAATFTAPVTAGNTIVAYYGLVGLHGVTINDTVNAGNYNVDVSLQGSARGLSVGIATFFNTASGTPTVTLHIGSNMACVLILEEWSGFPGPLDQTITFQSSSASTSQTVGPTGTLVQSSEVALCAVFTNLVRTLTSVSPWQSGNETSTSGNSLGTQNQITLSTNGVTGSFSTSSACQWVGVVSTYQAGGPVTLSLSGQTSTFSNGIIGATTGPALAAQTLTSTEGSLIVNPIPVPLSGQTAYFTIGFPSSTAFTLGGQTSTYAVGAISTSITGDVTLGLNAVNATFLTGVMPYEVDYTLDQGAIMVNLIGQTSTFTEGPLLTETIGAALAAQSVTSAEGVLGDEVDIFPTAQTLTSTEGIIAAGLAGNVTTNLNGQTSTFSEGVLIGAPTYTPSAYTGTFTEGLITFSNTSQQTYQLGAQASTFIEGILIQNFPYGMPNVVGQFYDDAILILEEAGVIDTKKLGYFSTWPVTIVWLPSSLPPATVLAQEPSWGSTFTVNQDVTLSVSRFPMAVADP